MQTPADLARLAEQLGDSEWYQFLDELDSVSRRRRRRQVEPETPNGQDRDALAAWLARKHLLADSGIREVWYLPYNAPPDEIRFLEVNDRLAGPVAAVPQVEQIDFALDIQGNQCRLFVADIASEQLDQIRTDDLRLPNGWTLEGARAWRRGA